jgi:hypothetical protein
MSPNVRYEARSVTREYYADNFKIVRAIVMLVAILLISLIIVVYDKHFDALRIISIVVMPPCVVFLFNGLLYYGRNPAITLKKEGFIIPGFAKELIPWIEVVRASKFYFYGLSVVTPNYKIEIAPSCAKSLTPQGLWRLLPSKWRRRSTVLYLPLVAVSEEPDLIFAEFTHRLAEAKRPP